MIKAREDVFYYYFKFMEERMKIFWKKFNYNNLPLTNDPILTKYKFTNVYRACDRVSQYLIGDLINNFDSNMSEEDILLNILVFKVFNKIETWTYLSETFGRITVKNYDADIISSLLSNLRKQRAIFSPAYIMTGSGLNYSKFMYKHERWLQMIKSEIIGTKKLAQITKSKSLEKVYNILIDCTFIGPFLAYQYTIDMNYSDVINFDENSFVKAGIGAQRGINKCFLNSNNYSYEDFIRFTFDNLEKYQNIYGTKFDNLFGRDPKLIDLQNCFCETDKYLREKMPSLHVGNKRIKQKYKPNDCPIRYSFPKKWKLPIR